MNSLEIPNGLRKQALSSFMAIRIFLVITDLGECA